MGRLKLSLRSYVKRFWSLVNKKSGVFKRVDGCFSECWVWTGNTTKGYGQFGGKGLSHRFAWELFYGIIPDGLNVLHKCDNKLCVRPLHLFTGTQLENVTDMMQKNRNWAKTKPELAPKGERNGAAKLTKSEVIKIRRQYAAGGTSHNKLGFEFGVSGTQIRRIVTGTSWTEL